jgi:RimJ/RimL family protein N-acetyltransferase
MVTTLASTLIRTAVSSDAEAIARVHISSWQAAYRDLMPAAYLASLDATLPGRVAYWTRVIDSSESGLRVAEHAGQVVGWISFGASRDEDPVGETTGEVMAIYVHPEHWGTGAGLALWSAGVRCLVEQGYRRLTLWVLAGNARAIRFYERAQWRPEAASRRTLVRGGVTLEEIRYEWLAIAHDKGMA